MTDQESIKPFQLQVDSFSDSKIGNYLYQKRNLNTTNIRINMNERLAIRNLINPLKVLCGVLWVAVITRTATITPVMKSLSSINNENNKKALWN